MIANGLTTLIGLYLTYVAIFGLMPTAGAHWREAAAGAAIVLLAPLARRSDVSHWQSTTNAALGAVLLVLVLADWVLAAAFGSPLLASPTMLFWVDLWIGVIVACVALWAAIYHPERGRAGAPLRPTAEPGLSGEPAARPGH